MSEQGVETIETTLQKTHDWIVRVNQIGNGEMQKIMDAFARDMHFLFPAPASAT